MHGSACTVKNGLTLLVCTLLLVGCATPKNAEEFRQTTRKGPFKLVETFEVARPFQDVSSTLKKKAGECLARLQGGVKARRAAAAPQSGLVGGR